MKCTQRCNSLVGGTVIDEAIIFLLEQACDWQWDSYLSAQLPPEYLEEINGLAIGGREGILFHSIYYLEPTVC
jgi:hypothetical protein